MKSKLVKSTLVACLAGAVLAGSFCFNATPKLQAAETEAVPAPKARAVIQSIARNFLNFRAENPLSEEQKSQIKTIVKSHHDEIRAQVEKAKAARLAFDEAAKADPESAETEAAADAIASSAKSRALLAAKIRSEVWPVLTEEQQQFADQARENIRETVDDLMLSLK